MNNRILVIVCLMLLNVGCATIPKESVELSQLVGEMITSAKVSHVNMVNRHFDYLRSEVEYFAFHDYKEALLSNIREIAKKRDPNFIDLSIDQYDRVIYRIQGKRNEWLQEVEKNRQAILQSLEEHYVVLTQANAYVTSLLRSSTHVSEVQEALLKRFGPSVGISGTKMKEVEDKVLESTNNIRSIMNNAITIIKSE